MKHSLHIIFLLILGAFLSGEIHGQDTVVCKGDLGQYAVSTTYEFSSTYHWDVEGGSIVNNFGNQIEVRWDQDTDQGRITVVERGLGGCEGEMKEYVVNIQSTFANIGFDQEICEGEETVFTTDDDYESYMWHDGSQQSYYTADSSGLIWVTVTDEYGCIAQDTARLTVHDNPDVNIDVSTLYPDRVMITDDSVSFAAGEVEYITLDAGIWNFYRWNTGETMSTIDVQDTDVGSPEAGKRTQDYWVTVENEYGCSATDSITITVYGKLRIPNAFTPGGDQINDKWSIPALALYPNCHVQIFDRHGKLVFQSRGYDAGEYWDGTGQNGQKLPMDSYYYIINLGNGDKPIYGTVTIIR